MVWDDPALPTRVNRPEGGRRNTIRAIPVVFPATEMLVDTSNGHSVPPNNDCSLPTINVLNLNDSPMKFSCVPVWVVLVKNFYYLASLDFLLRHGWWLIRNDQLSVKVIPFYAAMRVMVSPAGRSLPL